MNHEKVGRLIGLSAASVSRLRSGVRRPTLGNMASIGVAFNWPLPEQVALTPITWTSGFEAKIKEYQEAQRDADA